MLLGKQIKEYRNQMGWTQQQLADRLNVSNKTISSWETGRTYPDISLLITLSDEFDVSLDTLLKGDDKVIKKIQKDSVQLKVAKSLGMLIPTIIVGTCLLLDFVLNHSLTWSLIVALSIGLIALPFALYNRSKNSTLTFSIFSISLVVMLFLLEKVVNRSFMNPPIYWFNTYALPISLIWLAIFWIGFILWKYFKMYFSDALGTVLILASVGSILTNTIGNKEPILNWVFSFDQIMTVVLSISLGIGCFITGRIFRKNSI